MRALRGAVLIAAVSVVLAGCGGGGGSSSNATTASSGALAALKPKPGKHGGSVTLLSSTDVDYLDPGHTYYTVGYTVLYATQRPLYSFKPGQTEPVPDLAAGPPEISPDAQTITVKLRPGVRFSPPVNREVTSKDVKYAFERAFTVNVSNEYTTCSTPEASSPITIGPLKMQ